MPSAYGFESLRPHSIKAQSCDWAFIVSSRLEGLAKTVRSKGLVAFIKWRGVPLQTGGVDILGDETAAMN